MEFFVSVTSSRHSKPIIYSYLFDDQFQPILDLIIGDRVEFFAPNKFVILNVPEIWIARSGGESKYYVTPSLIPGEWRPFLGYDSQVHGVALRKHPTPEQKKVPPLEYDEDRKVWSWVWTAQRRMDSNKTDFDPFECNRVWSKTKSADSMRYFTGSDLFDIGGGISLTEQRNSQREGYNMQFLHSWLGDRYDIYTGTPYDLTLGLDSDEIVYLDGGIPSTDNDSPKALLMEQVEKWKIVPEGCIDPINLMVTAYQRNRSYVVDGKSPTDIPPYNGYEILDEKIYWDDEDPDISSAGFNGKKSIRYDHTGRGTYKNVKAPGQFLVQIGNRELVIPVNVNSPQSTDYGFYGSLDGDQWPAEYQENVLYALKGLANLSPEILAGFSMEYTYEDDLGILFTDTKYYKDGGQVDASGKWEVAFNIKGWGYHEITAYYQGSPNSSRVPIAGKELLEIDLRFLSVPGSNSRDFKKDSDRFPGIDLKEGRGEGKFWYVQDYNDDLSELEHTYGDRNYNTCRRYVFAKDNLVTFCATDADPHTFYHYDVEWYVSERFMAKRIPNNYLNWRIHWCIAPIDFKDDGVWEGSGRYFTHTWAKPGWWRLTAVYNGASKISHEIYVHNCRYSLLPDANKGSIGIYEINPDLLSWLQELNPEITEDWRVAKVEDIFSRYTYVDGPRATPPNDKPNRFGLENDFNAHFKWKDGSINLSSKVTLDDPSVKWFPKFWIRHFSGTRLPDDVASSRLPITTTSSGWAEKLQPYQQSIFDTQPEHWQWRLPWVSTTNWNGCRIRFNIKTIYYDLGLFDNEIGAFSGVGNTIYPSAKDYRSAVMAPFKKLTGLEKLKYDFYLDALSGRRFIYNPADIMEGLQVFGVDDKGKTPEYFIHSNPNNFIGEFMMGADMSSVKNLEDEGISWCMHEMPVDPYCLLAAYKANIIRLKLWVTPKYFDGTPYPYSVLESVKCEIIRAKKLGFRILLDLHYSDTWADPKQIIPSAWLNRLYDPDALAKKISDYTFDVLKELELVGALPNYIQIGNEIKSNMLMPKPYADFNLTDQSDVLELANIFNVDFLHVKDAVTIYWDRNAKLINAGLNAVKLNFPQIETILHIVSPETAEWWIDQAFNENAEGRVGKCTVDRDKVDIFGLSYYWGENGQQQSFRELKQICERITENYQKKTIIAETAYPRTYSWSDAAANLFGQQNHGAWPDEVDDKKQKNWLITLRETLINTKGSIGFLVWEPFWVGSNHAKMKDFIGSNWENMTFFIFEEGRPTNKNFLHVDGGINVFFRGKNDDFNIIELGNESYCRKKISTPS